MHALGVICCHKLRDPSAHGPTTEVDLLQPDYIKESNYDLRLTRNRIGKVCGSFAAPIPWEIRHVDVIARFGKRRRKLLPIFRSAAQTMNENSGLAVRRTEIVIVNAASIDSRVMTFCAVEKHLRLSENAKGSQRTFPERDTDNHKETEKNEGQPPADRHSLHFFSPLAANH